MKQNTHNSSDSQNIMVVIHAINFHSAKAIITANEAPLGTGQILTLKKDIDYVLEMKTDVKFVLVAKRTEAKVDMTSGRDCFLEEVLHLLSLLSSRQYVT